MSTHTRRVPVSGLDLWADDVLQEPFEAWRELRALGPAVHLPQYDLWALPRYAEVREALSDWQAYTSAQGVCLNPAMNGILAGGTLCSDPPEHDRLRDVLKRPLVPAEMKELAPRLREEADALVDRLVARGSFEAVADLSRHLPLALVSDLVGLPEQGRERMLDWAFANFDCFGPDNARTKAAFPILEEAVGYCAAPDLPERLTPGGWAARLFDAADAGDISREAAQVMLNDYWGPSLDTTIFAVTSAVWLFAQHPDQWDLVRADPALIPHAVNEVLRLESPLSQFARVTTAERDVGGVTVPAGARVLVMYGSANRDERKWADPERFDVLRRPGDHLGFGHGEHRCVGQPLARLELNALIGALAERVERFEVGAVERAINNTLRGIRRLEVTVTPTPART